MKKTVIFLILLLALPACSYNAATGDNQFTLLMSESQEQQIGAENHGKVLKSYGVVKDSALTSYVNRIGQSLARDTERANVAYTFTLLDSPQVNAFAVPGGYIYITRGILALANDEAEMASVLAHEIGHITARHSAERHTTGVFTQLGAGVLANVIGDAGVGNALGAGAGLYISSYSRDQEREADTLGVRYLSYDDYAPFAMSGFLGQLNRNEQYETALQGQSQKTTNYYFRSHPLTSERIRLAATEAKNKLTDRPVKRNRQQYLAKINGMIFGDTPEQGFIRRGTFLHPIMGFKFKAPDNFRLVNLPTKVVATNDKGVLAEFDMRKSKEPLTVTQALAKWIPAEGAKWIPKTVSFGGFKAATATADVAVKGKPYFLRRTVIAAHNNRFYRFQSLMPKAQQQTFDGPLYGMAKSFRFLSAAEKVAAKPLRIKTFTAKKGDTIYSIARNIPHQEQPQAFFRMLNGLDAEDALQVGQMYKTIVER